MEASNDRILIVDDEAGILSALERLLRRDHYEVLLANDPHRALDVLTDTDLAVIICDQRMPGMAGDEVLAKAAALRPDAYRISLTGYADLTAVQALINKAAINHFLFKPWDDTNLRQVVMQGVRWHNLVQENSRLERLTEEQNHKLEAWNTRLEQDVAERTEELRRQNETLVELRKRLESSLRDTVGVLAGLLEAISPSLGIHAQRVARLSREIGVMLKVPPEELKDIEYAALLHDIGMISQLTQTAGSARPRRTRPGQPRPRHPECGAAILSHVQGFDRVALAVRHQQERFDGRGLPNGLKGADIPLASRIIAVANAYDRAVFQPRDPTHVNRDVGVSALGTGEGSLFDPAIVHALLASVEKAGAEGSCDAEVQLSPRQLKPGMVLSRPIRNYAGILLLNEGTVLTNAFIEHISVLSDIDPLLTDLHVRTSLSMETPSSISPAQGGAPASHRVVPALGQCGSPAPAIPAGHDRSQPIDRGSPVASVPPPTESEPSAQVPRGTVLIVDDSQLVCNALRRELRLSSYESICATTGSEALTMLCRESPDVAITDLSMPGMSGEQLIAELHECMPDLPCIIVTGQATLEQVRKLSQSPNVAGFLVKPWDHRRLIAAIEQAIRKSHKDKTPAPF